MKRLFALLFVCLFLLSSCGLIPLPGFPDDPTETDETAPAAEEPEEELLYTLTAHPELDADAVDYYYSEDMIYNCFVITKDGLSGSIDLAGNVVTEPFCDGLVFTERIPLEGDYNLYYGLFADSSDGWGYALQPDGVFRKMNQGGRGGSGVDVYWVDGEAIAVITQPGDAEARPVAGSSLFTHSAALAPMNFEGYRAFAAVPVQKASRLEEKMDDNLGYPTITPVFETEKYALLDLNSCKLIGDFVYDEISHTPVQGVFAVRVGDKWGYVNDKGEALTETVYDASYAHEGYAWSAEKGAYKTTIYEMLLPVNGYIVTVKDAQYGLIDLSGKMIAANRFEYLSQVGPGGVFWAKENGVWYRGQLL